MMNKHLQFLIYIIKTLRYDRQVCGFILVLSEWWTIFWLQHFRLYLKNIRLHIQIFFSLPFLFPPPPVFFCYILLPFWKEIFSFIFPLCADHPSDISLECSFLFILKLIFHWINWAGMQMSLDFFIFYFIKEKKY